MCMSYSLEYVGIVYAYKLNRRSISINGWVNKHKTRPDTLHTMVLFLVWFSIILPNFLIIRKEQWEKELKSGANQKRDRHRMEWTRLNGYTTTYFNSNNKRFTINSNDVSQCSGVAGLVTNFSSCCFACVVISSASWKRNRLHRIVSLVCIQRRNTMKTKERIASWSSEMTRKCGQP